MSWASNRSHGQICERTHIYLFDSSEHNAKKKERKKKQTTASAIHFSSMFSWYEPLIKERRLDVLKDYHPHSVSVFFLAIEFIIYHFRLEVFGYSTYMIGASTRTGTRRTVWLSHFALFSRFCGRRESRENEETRTRLGETGACESSKL